MFCFKTKNDIRDIGSTYKWMDWVGIEIFVLGDSTNTFGAKKCLLVADVVDITLVEFQGPLVLEGFLTINAGQCPLFHLLKTKY